MAMKSLGSSLRWLKLRLQGFGLVVLYLNCSGLLVVAAHLRPWVSLPVVFEAGRGAVSRGRAYGAAIQATSEERIPCH